MNSDKQFVFIIGSLKSGTTWLQIMLGAHPQVCTTVEQTVFDKYISSWYKIWQKESENIEQEKWVKGLPFLWSENEFWDFLDEFLDKVYSTVVQTNPNATHILDKNPAYTFHIELINRFLPNAIFIHLIRDGRDTAVSMVAARKNIGYGPGNVIKAAAIWEKYVRNAQMAKKYPGQYLEVRYEDLLNAGEDTLKSVFEFCELPYSTIEIHKIIDAHKFNVMKAKRQHADDRAKTHSAFYRKGQSGGWQEELTPVQKYLVDRAAGDLLIELGYAEDEWWSESKLQKLYVPIAGSFVLEKNRLIKRIYQTAKARINPIY